MMLEFAPYGMDLTMSGAREPLGRNTTIFDKEAFDDGNDSQKHKLCRDRAYNELQIPKPPWTKNDVQHINENAEEELNTHDFD